MTTIHTCSIEFVAGCTICDQLSQFLTNTAPKIENLTAMFCFVQHVSITWHRLNVCSQKSPVANAREVVNFPHLVTLEDKGKAKFSALKSAVSQIADIRQGYGTHDCVQMLYQVTWWNFAMIDEDVLHVFGNETLDGVLVPWIGVRHDVDYLRYQ